MKDTTMVALFIIAILVVAGAIVYDRYYGGSEKVTEKVKKFSSYLELENFIKTNVQMAPYYSSADREMALPSGAVASTGESKSSADDYSQTNIQVQGVDEADFVKNDGKYIYLAQNNKIYIIDAYPAENAEILGEIEVKGSINEIYINENKLVVFGSEYNYPIYAGSKIASPPYYNIVNSFIKVYDISDKENPVLKRNISISGSYYNSRMVDDYVYVIAQQPVYYYIGTDIILPTVTENGIIHEIKAPDIYYFDYPDYSYTFTNIISVNTQDDNEDAETEVFLTSYAQSMYVSQDNVYLVYNKRLNQKFYFEKLVDEVFLSLVPSDIKAEINKIKNSDSENYEKISEIMNTIEEYSKTLNPDEQSDFAKELQQKMYAFQEEIWKEQQKTVIHRISINSGKIKYETEGEVTGYVLNQFSMDEYKEHFRIATTTQQQWLGGGIVQPMIAVREGSIEQAIAPSPPRQIESQNNLYVLNMDLKQVGSIEGLAEGERIYSARFIGDRAYLVTFRQVDPLFVIDLQNPAKPEVLGKLKIPGFSNYLHPYDEYHIIGIGQEVDETTGRTQGLKIALFDVSDVSQPEEISKYVFEQDSYSEALYDHKAFLFSKEKDLLVIPVNIYDWRYEAGKDNSFYGAYVFDISLDGIEPRGRIEHEANETYEWSSQIRRSLNMDDVLYTISSIMIKANSLNDLAEINKIELPYYFDRVYALDSGVIAVE